MQGFKRRKACGCGDHQTDSTSIKIEQVIEIDLPGQGTLVDIKADPENRRLQPAPDTAGDIKADPGDQPLQPAQDTAGDIKADPGDQPLQPAQDTAEGIPSNKLPARPRRAAADAGIAKRIKSKADDAMSEPSAERPKKAQTRKAPQSTAARGKTAASRHPKQQTGGKAVEVDGVIHIDVEPRAAAKPRARHAKRRRQGVQVYGLLHEPPADRMRMFGNFVGEAPQRIIICGENPSEWDRATQRCVPILVSSIACQHWQVLQQYERGDLSQSMLQHYSILMACSQFKSRPWKGPSNKLWPILLKEGIIAAKADEVLHADSSLPALPCCRFSAW